MGWLMRDDFETGFVPLQSQGKASRVLLFWKGIGENNHFISENEILIYDLLEHLLTPGPFIAEWPQNDSILKLKCLYYYHFCTALMALMSFPWDWKTQNQPVWMCAIVASMLICLIYRFTFNKTAIFLHGNLERDEEEGVCGDLRCLPASILKSHRYVLTANSN